MIQNIPIIPLITSFIVSFLTTPLVIYIYKRLKWLEDPKRNPHEKNTHETPVPRGGGIPIFISFLIASLIFLPLDQHLRGILLGSIIIFIMGFFDDRMSLNPYLRLSLCFLAAFAVVGSGIGIAFISGPGGKIINLSQPQINFFLLGEQRSIWILADILAAVWTVFLINTVNWAKGFDGQLPGIVAIAGITIALLSLKFSADVTQWPVAILATILAGAYLGFLPYNFYPQKIMPGYGGGAMAGFMLAVLAILSTTKIGTAIVVLGVPIMDAIYSIVRRLAKGKSPVWGDRGHLHHKILDQWKWGKRRAAIFYWGITAFLGLLALNLNSQGKFYTIALLAVVVGGLLLWFSFFSTFSNQSDQDKP